MKAKTLISIAAFLALNLSSLAMSPSSFASELVVRCLGHDANGTPVTAEISAERDGALEGRIFRGLSNLFYGPALATNASDSGGVSFHNGIETPLPETHVTQYKMETASVSGGGSCQNGVCDQQPQSSDSNSFTFVVKDDPAGKSAVLTQSASRERLTFRCR